MPRDKVIQLYKFVELDGRAKQRAVDKLRDLNVDHDWWAYTYDDFVAICEIIGIELKTRPVKLMGGGTRQKPCIWFSGFGSQGDGACFEGEYRYKADACQKIREYAPQDTELHSIVDTLDECQESNNGQAVIRFDHRGMYYHRFTMQFEVCDVEDSEGNEVPAAHAELMCESIRDLAYWLFNQLETEYFYLTSDEAVIESIRANDYEFDEHGNLS